MSQIFSKISDYFQGVSDLMSGMHKSSSVFPNYSDIGDSRENILLKYLKNHCPSRCSVAKGGFIFDKEGNVSKQIDLIIENDFTLNFKQFNQFSDNSKTFQCIEGSLAAISIKSKLNKNTLEDSLSNLASIPKMPDEMIRSMNPNLTNKESFLKLPKKIVFAFDGIKDRDKILEYLNKFYIENDFQDYQKADLIAVNNKYLIVKVKEGMKTEEGGNPPVGSYHIAWKHKRIGAVCLTSIIYQIQEASRFTPHILFNIDDYTNKINFSS